MFGDPHQMAMKIVNDDEFQSVYTYQVEGEKTSITDLLKVRRIGIPYATQMKMIRMWEIYERSTPTERKGMSDSSVVMARRSGTMATN